MKSDLRFRAQHASNLHFQKPGVARLQLRVEQQ
jgi:hypothetical protein